MFYDLFPSQKWIRERNLGLGPSFGKLTFQGSNRSECGIRGEAARERFKFKNGQGLWRKTELKVPHQYLPCGEYSWEGLLAREIADHWRMNHVIFLMDFSFIIPCPSCEIDKMEALI